jgi:sulfite exporter TauE/SafE
MHCVSCEKLLEDELGILAEVKKIKASRKDGKIEIFYDKNPDFSAIEKTIEKFGYKIKKDNPEKKEKKKIDLAGWIKAGIITILLIAIFKKLESLGVISSNIESSHLSYGVAVTAGVVASFSSCLALVGSIVVAFGEKFSSSDGSNFGRVLKPNLLFHAGRLGAFFVLGGLLGFIGGEINISGHFVAVYTLIIAFVMAWLGLNILGIIPSVSDLGLHMPKFLTNHTKILKKSDNYWAPIGLGALTFFLPCGFTQSMQILALTSGSFLVGGFGMFLFALGTLPVLLILGVTTSYTKMRGFLVFQKVAGMLILIFAVYVFNSGLSIWGVHNNIFSSKSTQASSGAPLNDNKGGVSSQERQIAEMHVTGSGFSPSVINIKKGVPVEWRIYGDNVTSCTSKIIVPDLNITQNISSGMNIVKFLPTKSGTIPFSCWMGMVRGKFVVE